MEQRRFHRVTCSMSGELTHHDLTYRVRLQNISLRGALITSDEYLLVPVDDTCTLTIGLPNGEPPLVITAQAVHIFFSMLGVKFVDFPDGSEQRLYELMKQLTTQPDQLREEWETVLHPPA